MDSLVNAKILYQGREKSSLEFLKLSLCFGHTLRKQTNSTWKCDSEFYFNGNIKKF